MRPSLQTPTAPAGGRALGVGIATKTLGSQLAARSRASRRAGPVVAVEVPVPPGNEERHPHVDEGVVPGEPPRDGPRRPGEGPPDAAHVAGPVGDLGLDPVGPGADEGVAARRGAPQVGALADPHPQRPAGQPGHRVGSAGPVADLQQAAAAHVQLQPGPLAVDRHREEMPPRVEDGAAAIEGGDAHGVAPGRADRHPHEGAVPEARHAGAVEPDAERRPAALEREGEHGAMGQGGGRRDQRELGARLPCAEHRRDSRAGVQGAGAAAAVGADRPEVARGAAEDRLDGGGPEARVCLAQQRDRPRDVGCRHRGAAQARPGSAGDARGDLDSRGGQVGLAHPGQLAEARRRPCLSGAGRLPAREAGDAPARAQGPHRQALGVDRRSGHAAPAVAGREDRHDPQLPPARDDRAQPLAGGAGRPPGGVDDARGVGGGGVAIRIGDPLAGGHERAEGGVAVAVERLGHHHLRAGGHPDGCAAGGAADHGPDRVGAVAVVVVGLGAAGGEIAPGDHLAGQVGVAGVDAAVDRADPDPGPVQPIVAPDGRRADGRQAPVAPAEEPGRGLGGRGRGRPEDPHGRVVLDAGDGRIGREAANLGRARPHGQRVREPEPARRARHARQEGRLAALGRAAQRADQVARRGLRATRHLVAEGHQNGQRPLSARKAGGQRGRERRRGDDGRGRRDRLGAGPRAGTRRRGGGRHGDQREESSRRFHRWTPWTSR